MSLISELKRRNVFKVAVAYAIVAWLLIQVVGEVLPTFEAPQWVIQTITFVILLGFPLALLLAWAYEITPEGLKAAADVEPNESITHITGQKFNYGILGLLFLAVGFLVVDQYVLEDETATVATPPAVEAVSGSAEPPAPTANSARIQRWSVPIGETQTLGNSGQSAEIAMAPNGEFIVYSANKGDGIQLYVRALDQLEAQPIPGTGGARHPAISPDSEWVVFTTNIGTIMEKLSIRGGSPQTLSSDVNRIYGASWTPDDEIVLSTTNGVNTVAGFLTQIPDSGGKLAMLSPPEPGTAHLFPDVLPGGKAVLYTNRLLGAPAGDGSIGLLLLETGEHRQLIYGGFNARYAPTGHIVFARTDALWAVPFDPEKLEITGAETQIVNGVQMNNLLGYAPYAFSNDGLLTYVSGGEAIGTGLGGAVRNLLLVDREGREELLIPEILTYVFPRFSPDGQHLAVSIVDTTSPAGGPSQDIWIRDLARGTSSRLTFDPAANVTPVWTPDGQNIVYQLNSTEPGLFRRSANGTGQAERLTMGQFVPESFTANGEQLIVREFSGATDDLLILSLGDDGALSPLIQTDFQEQSSALSPDGSSIAYYSEETGRGEIYVRPFPNIDDGKWQISRDGGSEPRWSPDGQELYFLGPAESGEIPVMATRISTEPAFSAGEPEPLFTGGYISGGGTPNWDITPDGQHFLFMKFPRVTNLESEQSRPSIVFVDNWFEELRRLAPVDGQ